MDKKCIFGIMVTNRVQNAPEVQKILTEYACNIKTRIGLHEAADNVCSPDGLILLEIFGDNKIYEELEKELSKINGLQVKKMIFDK